MRRYRSGPPPMTNTPSFRGDAKARTMVRNCAPENLEIPDRRFAPSGMTRVVLSFIRENDRASCCKNAADAVADLNFRILHLCRRDAAHLPHAFLQRIHAVHA